MRKMLFMILGCIGVVLGAIGAVVPLLPSFPFLLLATYSFARSSERLHNWFIHTKLYKNNLEDFVAGRGMRTTVKLRIMCMVSGLMLIGFIMMHNVPVGRMILFGVWVFHIVYFMFGIKTIKA